MRKNLQFLFVLLAFVFTFSFAAFGQETTGDIEITVKDPNGAVVPNITLTVASSSTDASATAGFRRTVTTDSNGYVKVIQVPPGVYTVTSTAVSGFASRVIPGVQVTLGRITPVNVELGVANVDPETVTVNSTDVNPIDTTDNKIQTNITAETAELLPKGVSFGSVLKVSPATRVEPLSGQYQIDGASGSENTFIIDGQEVTNVRTGVLDATADIPMQLVQEVQIKSSGFEAEYGGATGGVVNVVTTGGGNRFRGDFGASFQPGNLQARGRPTLYLSQTTSPPHAAYISPDRDVKSMNFFPAATFSGPIVKDRVWFRAAYIPQFFTRTRRIAYRSITTELPTGVVETYKAKSRFEYASFRLDAQPWDNLRLTGSYLYNPRINEGSIPSYASAIGTVPTNPTLGLTGAPYLNQTGGRDNSQNVTGQAVWTATNDLVISARGGHYYLNEKGASYGQGDITIPRVTCSASSPTQFPAGFGCVRGFNNGLPVDTNVLFDRTTRNTFDSDATYLFTGLGRHEIKGGVQYNGIANQVNNLTRSQIVFRYGQTIASYSGRSGLVSSPTAVGAGLLRQFRESGDVSSSNIGLYFQDKWQPTNRLTLNLGFRTEREDVPSFAEGLQGIQFDWQDKIAPRLGMAYDLTGDGKTKVSAFYGWFYDRFKYELPRGSFGGNFWHDYYYEIFPGDTMASLTEAAILGSGHAVIGGACPLGTTTPVYGRVRCDIDFRVPSNAGLGIEFGAIDPNLKAFRQSELTFTFERDLGRRFVFSGRYTHKQVDHAVEDAGFLTSEGSEAYIIANPGEGLYSELAAANGLLSLKPQREFDAMELRLNRRFANDYYLDVSYTLSRLYGNYSGLASSDEDGRLSPNVNRFFDLPHAGFTVAGGPDNGRLPTDRPHVLKFFGAYSLDWNKRFGFGSNNETLFGLFTTWQSGVPLTTTVDINNIDPIVVFRRGDLGRTEAFTQTDITVRHTFKFGEDSRFRVILDADILNVFNEANELSRNNTLSLENFDLIDPDLGLVSVAESTQPNAYVLAMSRFQRNGAPAIATFAAGAAGAYQGRYQLFNLTNSFQGGRSVRLGFRFQF